MTKESFVRLVVGLCVFAAACTASNPAPPPPPGAPAPERRRSVADPVADLAGMLSGRFQGATPGNGLQLWIEPVVLRTLSHPYDLFLQVRGRFEDVNVAQEGYIHLANQGRDVYLGYIPHFDPTISPLSPGAARFTSSELNAACSLYLTPRGDGYEGETQGLSSCAFAIHGATGKWWLRVEPGMITVRNVQSGETLRFRRVS